MYDISAIVNKKPVESEYVRFDKLSALIIDDIGEMRHLIRCQLQAFGMNSVNVARDAHEALRMIRLHPCDLIICDYNLNRTSSGQHFLEYLRIEQVLKARTVFVMVTAETAYSYVASAVEFAPDDYILKPCPERKLKNRLERLFDRRTYLMPVLNALDAKSYAQAVRECDRLLTEAPRERWLLDVLKRKLEALLALNDPRVADTLQQARAIRAGVPWVELAQARLDYAQGEVARAEEVAREILAANGSYVPAHELLAQICLKRNEEAVAFEWLKSASEILPSARRLRALSETAMLIGKLEEARAYSETAIRLSRDSMVETSDDYVRLAQVQVDLGDCRGAILTMEKVAHKFEETGFYGVSKQAVLAQAYSDARESTKARKLLERALSLLAGRRDSFSMMLMGKAALKLGDRMLGLKLLTQAVQFSAQDGERIVRHVSKAMTDTGYQEQIADVIDGGKRRILNLVEEANRAMRGAGFALAYEKLTEAFSIQDENVEVLLAAAQLHLLWLKTEGANAEIEARAKAYLATLDKLVPNHPKVMGFYKFFYDISGG
jgi:DNA-binding NarL/FixJ family response regulator